MAKRYLTLVLCILMFTSLIPCAAFAAADYDTVTIQKNDTVLKLLEERGRDYETDRYVVMVLNRMYRESQLEVLSIGDTIKIPKAKSEIKGETMNLISDKDVIEYFVIPYKIQKGDTLKNIYKLWGMSYLENANIIQALNPGKNPDKLAVGEIYNLPTTENNLKTNTYTTVMSHLLLKDETPESVFARYGIDFAENEAKLQQYNQIAFSQMKEGDKMLIPLVW